MKLQTICNRILHADEDYNLIEDNDIICVGISGGKDSIVLLAALNEYKRYSQHKFEIKGIHLDLGFNEDDMSIVENWCHEHGIEYHSESTKIAETLRHHSLKDGKISCSRCSKYKKACISEAARKYGCNKIAFAHHGDDAIETIFMNMIHGGRISTFLPKIQLEKNHFSFIRPLIYCTENEVRNAANINQLPIVKSNCPNDGTSERTEIKKMLEDIYMKYPKARLNFIKMLSDEKHLNIWHIESKQD